MKKINLNKCKYFEKIKIIMQYSSRIFLIIFISVVFGLSIYTWNAKSLKGDVFPMPFNIGMGVVLTESMKPNITTSDLIIVKKTNDYKEDEVVVYQSHGMLVVHRIIEINGDEVITQGDANDGQDEPINISQIKGEVVKVIGGVGFLVKILKTPIVSMVLLCTAILMLVFSYQKEKEQKTAQLDTLKEEILKLKKELEQQNK